MKKMISTNSIIVGDVIKTLSWRGEPSVMVTTLPPEFYEKSYAKVLNVDEVTVQILDKLPGLSKWYYDNGTAVNLIIKDPTMAYQEAYQLLLENLNANQSNRLERLTFETSDETFLSENFADFLSDWCLGREGLWDSDPQHWLRFDCLVRLFAEYQNPNVNAEVLRQYQSLGETTLRLVTNGTDHQLEHLKKVIDNVRTEGFSGEIRLVPLAKYNDDFGPNSLQVREMAIQTGFCVG